MKIRCLTVLFLAAVFGCTTKQRNEDFVPADDVAQRSLDRYLSAWRAGEPGETVCGTSPPISSADTLRAGGRKLEGYEILGPTPADVQRCYAVRLTLGNPHEEVRERYVVVGLDPIWVIRHEDYEKITHWCEPSPSAKKIENPTKPGL